MGEAPPRDRREEVSAVSPEWLRLVAEQVPAVLWSTDTDLRITSSSGAALTSVGLRPGEVVGQGLFDVIRTDDPEVPTVAAHLRALRGESVRFERARAGRVFDVHIEPLRADDGRVVGSVGLALDVTDRRRAEEALRRNEARFRALVQHASEVILLLGADGTLLYESPAVEAVLGYTPESLAGTNALALVHPDDVAKVEGALAALVADPRRIVAAEVRHRHRDGTYRDLAVTAANLLAEPAVGGIVVNARDITASKAAEAALRESERLAREFAATSQRQAQELALLDRVRSALARELDLPPLLRTAVEATAAAFGYSLVSLYLLEDEVLVLQHQVGYERVIERVPVADGVMGRVARTGESVLLPDGRRDPDFLAAVHDVVSEVCVPLRDRGRVVGALNLESRGDRVLAEDDLRLMSAVAQHVDVAIGRARLHSEVRASEARFAALIRNAPDLISILDANGNACYESPAIAWVLGYSPEELEGENALALVHPDDRPRVDALFAACLANPGVNVPADFRFLHRDGSWRWLEATGTNLLDDPSVAGVVVNSRDVTERRQAQERLEYLAYHDPLTGLPNRAFFMERLVGALDPARGPTATTGVLLLDLDGFKVINDGLGHAAGDRLLAAAAERLASAAGPGETVARMGGDEFAVLLAGVASEDEAARAGHRFLAGLTPPFLLNGHQAMVAASAGVAVGSSRQSAPDDVLRAADVALYRAKAAGKGSVAVFDQSMDEPALERLGRENELRRALREGEFRVEYQPQVDLATGAVVGVEALVRWRHPQRGLLAPGDFIPLAEETGLILPLGSWVLNEAVGQVRAWQERYPAEPPLRVGVNISALQLRHPSLPEDVARALRASALRPGDLTLEVTESAALTEAAASALRALKDQGVRLAIDDFGTAYASLNTLRRVPMDELKVDGSFVAGLGQRREDAAIVAAVVGVAEALGLGVVAEGIETAAQLAELRRMGCNLGQGHLFAAPMAAEDLDAFLRERSAHAGAGGTSTPR